MRKSKTVGIIATCIFFLGIISAANAENWVDTKMASQIDVDSIKRGANGLVFYNMKNRDYDEDVDTGERTSKWGTSREHAYDCEKGIDYYDVDKLSDGTKIKPNTMGSSLMEFVCSRVR